MGERAGRRAILVATGAVLAGVLASAGDVHVARAADRTFNISLVGSLNPLSTGPGTTNNIYADLWADGNLVVLGSVSTGSGVTIIDNANPAAPVMVSRYVPPGGPSANGQFRDVVVRNGIGYFAIDSSTTGGSATLGGTHIVNLANPAAPQQLAVINAPQGFINNHDLFLDGNFLYIADNRNAIMKVWNVANPSSPAFVRNITTAGATTDNLHDMTIKNGRMYTSNLDNGITQIYDVSNMSTTVAPTLLGEIDVGTRNHSTWPSEDGNLLAIAREDANGEVQLWNISNPAAPSLISSITAGAYGIDSFSAHNPIIVGDTLYASWYQAGLQIFNIRNPAAPVHLGAYDTFVGGFGNVGSFGGYDGNWGLDVSGGPSKILLSDFDNGFFTVDATAAFRQVWTYDGGPLWWQDNARWDNGAGPFPNSSEMIAAFTNPAAGATRTVWVEGFVTPSVPRAAGMEFLSTLAYTIQGAGAGAVELISSDGPAKITVIDGGGAAVLNRIQAPLMLNDDLLVTNNAPNAAGTTLELSTITATDRTITFAGTGATAMVAANPNFTGNIVLSSGTLTLRHGQAVNAQPIAANGGVLVLRNDTSTDYGSDLTVAGAVSLALGNGGGGGSGQTHALDNISVATGATLTLIRNNATHLAAGDLSVAGTMHITSQPAGSGGGQATRLETLHIPAGGQLDLTNTPLVVTSMPVAAVEGLVRSAYHASAWDGSGLTTSQQLARDGLATLAVTTAAHARRATFGGFSVSGDDVLVMFTYAGDLTFDGLIDAQDYGIIDNWVQFPGTAGYANGDINYDGVIDAVDYGIIDNSIQLQGPPLQGSANAASVADLTAVPEPSACGFALAAAMATLTRRRRGRRH